MHPSSSSDQDRLRLSRAIRRQRLLIESSLQAESDAKAFYRYASTRMNGSLGVPDLIEPSGRLLTSHADKATAFVQHFFNTFAPDNGASVSVPADVGAPGMADLIHDDAVILRHLRRQGSKLTRSPDNLSPIFSKCALDLCSPLLIICRRSLSIHEIPSAWRRSFVTLVFKNKGFRSSFPNYRPIAFTSVVFKVLESIIAEQIMLHCEVNSLLDPQQFGSRSGCSTTLQLVDMLDHWMSSLNSGRPEIDAVYIDFRAAFDVVKYRLLLRKLESFGMCPSLISWIAAFLRDRTFSR